MTKEIATTRLTLSLIVSLLVATTAIAQNVNSATARLSKQSDHAAIGRLLFNGYLGWFDGNVTNLFRLSPESKACCEQHGKLHTPMIPKGPRVPSKIVSRAASLPRLVYSRLVGPNRLNVRTK